MGVARDGATVRSADMERPFTWTLFQRTGLITVRISLGSGVMLVVCNVALGRSFTVTAQAITRISLFDATAVTQGRDRDLSFMAHFSL